NYRVSDYTIELDNGIDTITSYSGFNDDLEIGAEHKDKAVHILVGNPHKIPFWYTLFSGDKVLLKGYGSALDTIISHRPDKAVHFRINYMWDDEEKSKEISSVYNANALKVQLLAPDAIYPGQKLNMKVLVTDAKNHPVPDVDLTAYAHTSKFNSSNLFIPYFGRPFYRRKKNTNVFESEKAAASGQEQLNWQRWSKELSLDTIEYFKFTHPGSLYRIEETATDSITQFAPFVMNNGDIEPVNIIYLDEIPVFFDQADQLQRYAFEMKPGRHDIGLRTARHSIWLKGLEFKKGVKTILSVQADTANKKAYVTNVRQALSVNEAERLNRYMIRIANNFKGEKTFVEFDTSRLMLNPFPSVFSRNNELLVGPLQKTNLFFRSGDMLQLFTREPGYTYTFQPGLIKQKSFRPPFAFDTLMTTNQSLALNYKDQVLQDRELDSLWTEAFNLRSRTTDLFSTITDKDTATGRLVFYMDTLFTNHLPYIKSIFVTDPEKPQQLLILKGATDQLPALPAGNYSMLFLLKDNRYFKTGSLTIKPNGTNYYEWKSFKVFPADSFSKRLDASIKAVPANKYDYYRFGVPYEITRLFNEANYDYTQLKRVMTGKIFSINKRPLAGVSIVIEGLNSGVMTDKEGRFKLAVPAHGKVTVQMVGYVAQTVDAINGDIGDLVLEEMEGLLDEVVVTGYGAVKRTSVSGSIAAITSNDMDNALMGRAAGVSVTEGGTLLIRGVGSPDGKNKPLIMVDGIPFTGDISTLNAADVEKVTVLKSAEATAIYGARAADGVIIIKTKKGSSIINEEGVVQAGQQNLRTHFSDEAFWQPRLVTDEKGSASFLVQFPDDITSWKTRVIAINDKKQSGLLETVIRSFKTLSANFVSPLFAVD
ncbi:MAG TPA: carboxypeptidase-like regulatory domain-containing protein, partial [Niabella sp.]